MWIWCRTSPAQYWIDYICTNASTIRVSREVVAAADDGEYTPIELFRKNTDFLYMEIFANGTSNTFFRNGSAAVFSSSTFVRWITAPDSYYVMVEIGEPDDNGIIIEKYSNGTTRKVLTEEGVADDENLKNIGFDFIDTYTNGT